MKQLIETLHLILCNRDHEYQIEEVLKRDKNPKCLYYVDCQLGDTEEAKDLIVWTEVANKFILELQFKNPEDAMNFLRRVLMVLQGLSPAIDGVQKRKEFIKVLLGD